MEDIAIFDLQRALEPALGIRGARHQILVALRRGDLRARCATFINLNARDHSTPDYPDSGAGVELPREFWAPSTWIDDGEMPLVGPRPSDIWTTVTSWERGDFTISGSLGRGTVSVVRRATGITFLRNDVRQLLRPLGIALPGGEEEMLSWAIDWIRQRVDRGEPHGYRKMIEPFAERFPSSNSKRLRAIHANAKGILSA